MPSFESNSYNLCVEDILALSDTDLVRYLQENRRQDGGFDLEFEGWENLPKDQRDNLAQRLRTGAQNANDTVQSRPVDLDQVAARLLEVSANKTESSQTLFQPSNRERFRTLTPPTAEEYEIEAYNTLVSEGGRPVYPITLLEEVSQNPGRHHELLRPWLNYPNTIQTEWEVFRNQRRSWREFRQWQKYNRGDFGDWEDTRCVDVGDTYNRFVRAFGCETPDYTEAVKILLEQHGFTRSFQFHEDATKQDKLTTWIEYVGFEFWQLEWSIRSMKHLRPKYDAACQKLVDLGVLKPSEMAESLRTTESAFRRSAERQQAEKAVESAKSAAGVVLITTEKARNDPLRSQLTGPERKQMLREAQSKLDAAKASLKAIQRRNDLITGFIRGTWDYKRAEKDADYYSILTRWTLEQLPLLEAELEASMAADGVSYVGHGTKRRLSCCQDDDDPSSDRSSKSQRGDDQSLNSKSRAESNLQVTKLSKRCRRDDTTDGQRPTKRFRGSSQDSNFLHRVSDGISEMPVGGSQQSGIPVARDQDDVDNKAVLKHVEIAKPRRLRPDGLRSPKPSQQLRRSPRIAAHHQLTSTVIVASPCSSKCSRQRPRRKITRG